MVRGANNFYMIIGSSLITTVILKRHNVTQSTNPDPELPAQKSLASSSLLPSSIDHQPSNLSRGKVQPTTNSSC